jgi:hypothetical protein
MPVIVVVVISPPRELGGQALTKRLGRKPAERRSDLEQLA